MTDSHLVAKKLAQIEAALADLRQLANVDALETDRRELRFVEHTLQIAIQAALDAAGHVVADERLGEPRSYGEMFALLAAARWIEPDLAAKLRSMAGFRNLLVHGYAEVDPARVREVVQNRLGDLVLFVATIRARLA